MHVSATVISRFPLSGLEEDLRSNALGAAEKVGRRAERTRVERRFTTAAGFDGAVDHDAVEAARQMPIIREVIDVALPDAIVRCVRIHRLSARAVGARYIRDIAQEPECAGTRYR
jgi:hypothetical protein